MTTNNHLQEQTAYLYKDIWSLFITNILLLLAVIFAIYYQQLEVAMVALLMFGISLMPHYLKGIHNIHVPIIFIYGSIAFIFASIILGQFNDFYDKFHWYDAFLHFISAVVFGIIGFLIIYVFYTTNNLRIPRLILILFAFSFTLMIGVTWEIIEFIIDRLVGTNLQVNSLEDTMVDLILDMAGAILASIISAFYLSKLSVPLIEKMITSVTNEVVDENKHAVSAVTNQTEL